MNLKKIIIITVLCITGIMITFSQQNKINLTINIKGIRNNSGQILIVLFNKKTGFPDKSQNAYLKLKIKIENNQAEANIKDMNSGEYAVSIIHDENNNDKLDTNSIGMPKEGTGFSNNPKIKNGPASYDEAKVYLNKKKLEIIINCNYL